MTSYLVRDARILGGAPTDLLLENGVLARIGSGLDAPGVEVVEGLGL